MLYRRANMIGSRGFYRTVLGYDDNAMLFIAVSQNITCSVRITNKSRCYIALNEDNSVTKDCQGLTS